MRIRAITGLFFVIVMVGSMLLGRYVFAGFFIVLSGYCLKEFYRMISVDESKPQQLLGLILGVLGFCGVAGNLLAALDSRYLLLLIPLVLAVFVRQLYQQQGKPFDGISRTLLGVIYVVLPFIAFFALGFVTGTYDHRLPLGFMLMLWGNDTGAYLAGKFLGKNRLFERISPNKTWEGFVGGIVLALVTGAVLAYYFPLLAYWQWLCTALVISLFGTFGDLVESMLKRSLQVKDSGALLPGHGGLLDRFDGLLFAAPAVLVFLALVY